VPTVNGHLFLLHDGRARGFAEAISGTAARGGGARGVSPCRRDDRAALVRFLESL
jgi:CxxC motif-containing protein (DUF1111 family)